jgi:hypothetical protein
MSSLLEHGTTPAGSCPVSRCPPMLSWCGRIDLTPDMATILLETLAAPAEARLTIPAVARAAGSAGPRYSP